MQTNSREVNSAGFERQVIRPMKLFAAKISGLIATIPIVNDKRNITNQAKWGGTQFYVPDYGNLRVDVLRCVSVATRTTIK